MSVREDGSSFDCSTVPSIAVSEGKAQRAANDHDEGHAADGHDGSLPPDFDEPLSLPSALPQSYGPTVVHGEASCRPPAADEAPIPRKRPAPPWQSSSSSPVGSAQKTSSSRPAITPTGIPHMLGCEHWQPSIAMSLGTQYLQRMSHGNKRPMSHVEIGVGSGAIYVALEA